MDIVFVTLLRTAIETATADYTIAASQWRGPHCLNIAVVLAVGHGLLGLLRVGTRGRASHPPTPVPSKPPRFCGRKATCLLTECSANINNYQIYLMS